MYWGADNIFLVSLVAFYALQRIKFPKQVVTHIIKLMRFTTLCWINPRPGRLITPCSSSPQKIHIKHLSARFKFYFLIVRHTFK